MYKWTYRRLGQLFINVSEIPRNSTTLLNCISGFPDEVNDKIFLPCVASLCFSVLLALCLPRFWKERAGLSDFRAFVCFAPVGLFLFPLPLGVGD